MPYNVVIVAFNVIRNRMECRRLNLSDAFKVFKRLLATFAIIERFAGC